MVSSLSSCISLSAGLRERFVVDQVRSRTCRPTSFQVQIILLTINVVLQLVPECVHTAPIGWYIVLTSGAWISVTMPLAGAYILTK